MLSSTASILSPIGEKNNNTPIHEIIIAEKGNIHKVKSATLFIKGKVHHIQSGLGRLVLKLTIKRESS